MTDEVVVREASDRDAPFLMSLAREAYQEVLSAQFEGWEEFVHGARFAEKIASLPFWIAEVNGEPAATISSSVHPDHVRVNELVVLPRFQNHGLGSFLLRREIERARSLALPLRLHTFRLNRAVRLYERHGLVVTSRDDVRIDFEWTDDTR